MSYLKQAFDPATQTEQADPRQVKNNAGGFTFALDDWGRLERFLILGAEGGTYYVGERKLVRDNAKCVERCIKADGPRVVKMIVDISDAGRAPKNDPAIFALAMASRLGDDAAKAAAYAALPKVCRIGTHLYHFVEFSTQMGGWGRGLRRAVASWFTGRTTEQLAHQLTKYQQRDGWSARDLLRLSHAKPSSPEQSAALAWAVKGFDDAVAAGHDPGLFPMTILAHEEAKTADLKRLLTLIEEYKLPRESVPTQHLTNPDVWAALLPHMGATALVRNLATMTRVGLLAPLSASLDLVSMKLASEDFLKKGRVHPIAMLSALRTYASGRGERGGHAWTPVARVVDALDAGFYASFATVEPTGKRTLLALDVSGSMSGPGTVVGVPGLTAREASAAMAMVTAATEPRYHVVGFSHGIRDLPISPKMRLDQVIQMISGLPFERTDCSLPMRWAQANDVAVDSFAIYTDNETWHGPVHPHVALASYQKRSGIAARLAVVATSATEFTIADPTDPTMLDVVGFDSSAPAVIADFFRGGNS